MHDASVPYPFVIEPPFKATTLNPVNPRETFFTEANGIRKSRYSLQDWRKVRVLSAFRTLLKMGTFDTYPRSKDSRKSLISDGQRTGVDLKRPRRR
jgi:hypothetical protein